MNKIYLLLRNNKQSGPHSIEELEQLCLKMTDLIWVEGQSAGWRNPTEIDTLKSNLPGFLPQKAGEDKKGIEKTETLAEQRAAPIINGHPAHQKHLRNVFVSLPSGFQAAEEIEFPEESMSEKLEKKAQELLNKVQAYSQEKNLAKNTQVIEPKYTHTLDDVKKEYPNWRKQQKPQKKDSEDFYPKASGVVTKYTRSLNDIKEEYFSWLEQQKKKTSIGNKPLVLSAIIITIIALAFFRNSFNEKMTNTVAENSSSPTLQEVKDGDDTPGINKNSQTLENDFLPDAKFFNDQMNKGQNNIIEETSVIDKAKAIDARIKEPTQQEKKEQKIIINRQDDAVLQASFPQPEKKQDPVEVINRKNDETSETATSKPKIKEEKPSVPLTQLIDIDGDYLPSQKGDGVNGYRVTMQNNSKQMLNVVAVDVLYYGANDKFLNKKTLYFSNVTPGAKMILTAPSNKYAVAVNHQLGLVSGEEGAIYFVKQ